MINSIQPVVAVRDNSFDELKSDNKKERFDLLAEQFKSEFSADKNSSGFVSSDNNKENDIKNSEKEQTKVNADLTDLGNKLKDMLQDSNSYLEFKMDKDTNRMILRLIDNETKEVIQQFPPELALKIARIISSLEGSGQIANAKI